MNRKEYEEAFLRVRKVLASNGMIRAFWLKVASKVPTDLNDNVIRQFALKNGLVDVKVCAVDETWPGLKLVIPLKDRK